MPTSLLWGQSFSYVGMLSHPGILCMLLCISSPFKTICQYRESFKEYLGIALYLNPVGRSLDAVRSHDSSGVYHLCLHSCLHCEPRTKAQSGCAAGVRPNDDPCRRHAWPTKQLVGQRFCRQHLRYRMAARGRPGVFCNCAFGQQPAQ